MSTLHIMVGVPGAGKSTYSTKLAESLGCTRVSFDEIMEEIRSNRALRAHWVRGEKVREEYYERIASSLASGDVVADSTHVHTRDLQKLMAISPEGTDFKVYWFDISPEVAVERQKQRKRQVPAPVIRMMWMAMQTCWKQLGRMLPEDHIVVIDETVSA